MKKNILCISLITSINVLYGMEVTTYEIVRRFVYPKNPKIVVVQDDIYNRRTKAADITIFGETEQMRLHHPGISFSSVLIGSLRLTPDNMVMFIHSGQIESKQMDNEIVFVMEPRIIVTKFQDKQALNNRYKYKKTLKEEKIPSLLEMCCCMDYEEYKTCNYTGYQAIEHALKDLRNCYKSVLYMTHHLNAKSLGTKSIALSTLSTALGIPAYRAAHVAVASVIEFISDSSNECICRLIELVVNSLEDFNTYKAFLMGYATEET